MGGPVTYSVTPFASTVLVGDAAAGSGVGGAGPSVVTTKMFAGDDLDDGTPAGKARAEAYVQKQIAAGVFKQADIDKGTNAVAKEVDNRPPPATTGTSIDCSQFASGFNMGTKLTANTTLGDFVNKLVAIPNCKATGIPAQMGLEPHQIVCNLAHLCLNVWEPIKAKYPNAIITNSLRTGSNIGAGPHGTGQGMDIQFNTSGGVSIPPAEYFAIAQWVKDNVAYDQLLLEYSTQKGYLVAWLHCSIYAGTGKKVNDASRVMTFMNHSSRGPGLQNLAN